MCCCSSSSIIYFQSSRHLKAKAKTPSCRSSAGTVGSSASAQTVQTMLCESNFLLLFITCSSKFDCFDTNWMYFGTGLGAWHSRTPDSTLWVTQMQSEWENTFTFKLVNWNTTESWFQKRYRCICWHGLACFVDCAASSGRFCRGRRSISSSTLFWIKPIFTGNTFKGKWQMLISTKNI